MHDALRWSKWWIGRLFAGEIDMLQVFASDEEELKDLATLIRQNKLRKAFRTVEDFDTALLEELPMTVWNWLERVTDN